MYMHNHLMQINLGLQADLFLSTHFHGIILDVILDGGQENDMITEQAPNFLYIIYLCASAQKVLTNLVCLHCTQCL